MTKIEYSKNSAMYFTVLSDGKFHHAVPEGTDGAVKREYETSDGQKGVKWEITAESISGQIVNFSVFEGDYGKQLHIYFSQDSEDERQIVISLNMTSSFAEDFLKKLPNIDTDKPVKLVPYSFEDDNGKKKRGLTVYQNDKKVQGYYHELKKVGKTEKWIAINGYPELPKTDKWDSDDWKMYFTQARKFLIGELEKHPLYDTEFKQYLTKDSIEYPTAETDPNAIEF